MRCKTSSGVAGLVTNARRVATLAAYDSSVSKASGAAMFLTTTRASSTAWAANSASLSGAMAGSAAFALGGWLGGCGGRFSHESSA